MYMYWPVFVLIIEYIQPKWSVKVRKKLAEASQYMYYRHVDKGEVMSNLTFKKRSLCSRQLKKMLKTSLSLTIRRCSYPFRSSCGNSVFPVNSTKLGRHSCWLIYLKKSCYSCFLDISRHPLKYWDSAIFQRSTWQSIEFTPTRHKQQNYRNHEQRSKRRNVSSAFCSTQ